MKRISLAAILIISILILSNYSAYAIYNVGNNEKHKESLSEITVYQFKKDKIIRYTELLPENTIKELKDFIKENLTINDIKILINHLIEQNILQDKNLIHRLNTLQSSLNINNEKFIKPSSAIETISLSIMINIGTGKLFPIAPIIPRPRLFFGWSYEGMDNICITELISFYKWVTVINEQKGFSLGFIGTGINLENDHDGPYIIIGYSLFTIVESDEIFVDNLIQGFLENLFEPDNRG